MRHCVTIATFLGLGLVDVAITAVSNSQHVFAEQQHRLPSRGWFRWATIPRRKFHTADDLTSSRIAADQALEHIQTLGYDSASGLASRGGAKDDETVWTDSGNGSPRTRGERQPEQGLDEGDDRLQILQTPTRGDLTESTTDEAGVINVEVVLHASNGTAAPDSVATSPAAAPASSSAAAATIPAGREETEQSAGDKVSAANVAGEGSGRTASDTAPATRSVSAAGSKPSPPAHVSKPDQTKAKKEEALRNALLAAVGSNKILRQVERIPALRRLSDSALRVSSASAADGRLSALALYRLGAAARAAETAASTHRTAVPPASHVTADADDTAAPDENSETRPTVAAGGEEKEDGEAVEPSEESDRSGGGTRQSATGPGDKGNVQEEEVGGGNEDAGSDETQTRTPIIRLPSSKVPEKEGEESKDEATRGHANGGEDLGGKQREDQNGRGSATDASVDDSAPAVDAITPQATASSTSPAAPAALSFDVKKVTSDHRFEQLIEIIECVAAGLSVTDVSKVVWGLSILGHVPRNSLLESLARILTDRLRSECDQSALAKPSGTAAPAAPVAGKGKASEGGEGGATTAGGTTGASVEGSPTASSRGSGPGECSTTAGEWAVSDTAQATSDDVDSRGGDPEGTGRRAAPGDTDANAKPAQAGAVTVTVTPGADLATAALSFAYAHASLDVSTGELLEVIAACVTPQLPSMPLRDLANLAWAFGVQGKLDRQMMAGIAREISSDRFAGRMSAGDVSNFAWSYSILGLRPEGVVRALTREGLATMDGATPHDMSNLAWGLARASVGGSRSAEIEDPLLSRELGKWSEGAGDAGVFVEDGNIEIEGTGKIEQSGKGDRVDDRISVDGDATEASKPDQYQQQQQYEDRGSSQSSRGGESEEGVQGAGGWGLGWMGGKRGMKGDRRHSGHAGKEGVEGEGDQTDESFSATAGDTGDNDEGYATEQEEERTAEVGDRGKSVKLDGANLRRVDEGVAQLTGNGDEVDADEDTRSGPTLEKVSVEQRLGEALLAKAGESFRQFQPKQLSRLCWALGAWHGQGIVLSGSGLFAARALKQAGKHPKEYTAKELAQVLWSFAKLVGNADSPAQELAGLMGALAEGFESEGVRGCEGGGLDAKIACDVLWSFATMGHPTHSLCETLGRDLSDQVQELPLTCVASLAWAYAKMGHPSAELMERVLSVVERRLRSFSVEDAANALWALGALGYTVSLKREFYVTKEKLRPLNPSASAKLLWGLAKTEVAFADDFDRECLEAVAADMSSKILSFSPRELCRTAWALGRLGLGGVLGTGGGDGGGGGVESEDDGAASTESGSGGEIWKLMDKLVGECSKWLELFTPQELETLLWALCRLEHRADGLVAEMAKEAKRRQEGLPTLVQESGPTAARDAAFHLGAFRHLLAKYQGIDFDGRRARGRYSRGKSMLSRMFRER